MPDPVMMPALTIERLLIVYPVLAAVGDLTPPPTPKGRYVLGKALEKAIEEKTRYEKAYMKFAEGVVTQDAVGKPIFNQTANGQVSFTVRADKREEHTQWIEETQSEVVTLAGVRQITNVELGVCPITVAQCGILVSCGLLQDEEPA